LKIDNRSEEEGPEGLSGGVEIFGKQQVDRVSIVLLRLLAGFQTDARERRLLWRWNQQMIR